MYATYFTSVRKLRRNLSGAGEIEPKNSEYLLKPTTQLVHHSIMQSDLIIDNSGSFLYFLKGIVHIK